MQIDWLTVAAQIVNFLILVWLLQRFLYRPITEAMRRRESRIESRLAEAREARDEAAAEAGRLREERAALAAAKEDMLSEARAEAEDLRAELDADLRADIAEKRAAWHRQLAQERDAFARDLQRQAGHQLLDITARVLSEYADTDLSERMAGAFAARIAALDEATRARLAAAAGQAARATVESDRPLDAAARARITRALHAALSTSLPVDYRETPDLLLGARLTIGEQSVEWSAAHHLSRLGTTLDEILDATRHGAGDGSAGAVPEETEREGARARASQ